MGHIHIEAQQQGLGRKETAANFVEWLKAGSCFFHISGKPGAGKSTLMKFLCKNTQARDYLQAWADDSSTPLAFSQFFFLEGRDTGREESLRPLTEFALPSSQLGTRSDPHRVSRTLGDDYRPMFRLDHDIRRASGHSIPPSSLEPEHLP